jgi:hypothetical protein
MTLVPAARAVLQMLQMPRPKTMRERSPVRLFRDRNMPASRRDP